MILKFRTNVKEHFVLHNGISLHLITSSPEQITPYYVGQFAQALKSNFFDHYCKQAVGSHSLAIIMQLSASRVHNNGTN